METKLCRICGKLGQNNVHIFRMEGLRNKIETCLPIVVSPHSLLPDTMCGECLDNVDNWYSFIKNCLQTIIILEAQYDITESCLKTKRKHDKSCMVDMTPRKVSVQVQTDDQLDLLLKESENIRLDFEVQARRILGGYKIVDYEISDDSGSDDEKPFSLRKPKLEKPQEEEKPPQSLFENHFSNRGPKKRYFSDTENYLIDEITQRKRRKIEEFGESSSKRSSRRKNRPPMKVEHPSALRSCQEVVSFSTLEKMYEEMEVKHAPQQESVYPMSQQAIVSAPPQPALVIPPPAPPPQVCLLCEEEFTGGPSMMAAHVYETHGIDMAHVMAVSDPSVTLTPVSGGLGGSSATERGSGNSSSEKKKKLPNLLKISDLKKCDGSSDDQQMEPSSEEPPTLLPSFVCHLCPAVFTTRPDLFTHLRVKHPDQAALLCGMCLHQATTLPNLQSHVEVCTPHHPPTTRHVCQICRYGEDNQKTLENHILVHDFLIETCKKQSRMFDPADYIDTTSICLSPIKNLACSECGQDDFESFKDFSTHRRSQHQIFHCDLCNKFYGRNSHLWKHVNRLHKSHPSITCQLCFKTSASKYHLSQHFNKIHSSKPFKKTEVMTFDQSEDFMSQKFQGFDFQSVKQSFMRQELLEQQQEKNTQATMQVDEELEDFEPPKAIDSSSDLYTNIITNYTPPANEGDFKCPKCGKGFFKKNLLKKHKKNCRPRLQKDLLTRCKTCARVFKDRQSLAKHLVNYHSEYNCEICKQQVQSKCEIVSHIRFSHPGCHLFCKICGYILRCAKDLIEHSQDHMNSYVCQFCADALPSKIKLKMHILSLHRKILSLSCGVCLKLFESQHILRDHVKLIHKDQLNPLTSCTVCGKNYGSKWKTYDHLNKSHGRIFKACKTCLEVFDTEEQLGAHYGTAHANSKPPPAPSTPVEVKTLSESEESECSDPELDFQKTGTMSLLERRLLGVPKKETTTPVMKNKTASPIDPHNSSKRTVYVNSNDPSFCEICMKTWPAKKHLWQHYIRCHKEVAATVCGICLKTNDSYLTLQNHLTENHPNLLHGKGFGSNFICRICGRYHNASSKLKLHMAIHDGFDWTLFETTAQKEKNGYPENEEVEEVEEDEEEEEAVEEDEAKESSDTTYDVNVTCDNTINYESLIEQVECSSGSESDNEENNINVSGAESSSSDDDNEGEDEGEEEEEEEDEEEDDEDDDEEDDNEEEEEDDDGETNSSANSLEAQMLRNMLQEKNGDVKEEYDESGESWSKGSDGNFLRCKTEELDSAIESIKYEVIHKVEDIDDDDYCDMTPQTLNDNEIESAVGSIL